MNKGLSVQTLEAARGWVAGQAGLEPLLLQLLGALSAVIDSSVVEVREASDNPEVSASITAELEASFVAYREALSHLGRAVEAGDRAAGATALETAEGLLQRIRAANRAAAEELSGPAGYPLVNKAVRHIDYYLQGGSPNRHTAVLLAQVPAFCQEREAEMGQLTDFAAQLAGQSALEDMRSGFEVLQSPASADALQAGRDLLVSASGRLTSALLPLMQSLYLSSPTAVPPVNLVLKLASMGIAEADFHKAIETCDAELVEVASGATNSAWLEANQQVRTCLARVREGGAGRAEALSALEAAATTLGQYSPLEAGWNEEDDDLLDFTSHDGLSASAPRPTQLPSLFQSALDAAQQFVLNGAGESDANVAIEVLDQFVQRFERQATQLPEAEREYVDQALKAVQEAATALRHLMLTGDARSIDAARAWFEAAAEAMATGAKAGA